MNGLLFPGQGSQYEGMGSDFVDQNHADQILNRANEVLGWDIASVMKNGSAEDLVQTKVTQPAIFIHSYIRWLQNQDMKGNLAGFAGHSLGEFTALVVASVLRFEDGLDLVSKRALAMQKATEETSGTMAAIIGLDDKIVEEVCINTEGIVVPANYNSPGQLVISGEIEAVKKACETLTEQGAKRAIMLTVGGAFHSPLMESAEKELSEAILSVEFIRPSAAVFQNFVGRGVDEPDELKENLVKQLTGPVRWTQCMNAMIHDGIEDFIEIGGKGNILKGMLRKIDNSVNCTSV